MKNKYALIFAAVICAVSAGAQQPAFPGEGAFAPIADAVVESNPALKAEEALASAEIEELRAENVLENPELEFEHLWSGTAENKWNIGITQSLPWPGTFGARSSAASALAEAKAQSAMQSRRDLRLKTLQLLADIVGANRRVALLTEIRDNNAELRKHYEKAWQMGETTILDLNKIKIEEINSEGELAAAQTDREALLAELGSLAPDADVAAKSGDLTDYPAVTLSPLEAYLSGVESSPELASMRALSAAEERNEAVAKALRLPGISLGYRHAYEEMSHFNGFSVGVTLPVYSRKHSLAAVRSRRMAAEFSSESLRMQLEQTVRVDFAGATTLRSQIALYAPVVENVNNLALLRKALDGGQLSLLDYLQEVSYFLRARLDFIDLNTEYTRTAFALSRYL